MLNLAVSKKRFIKGTFATKVAVWDVDWGPGTIDFYKYGIHYLFDHLPEMNKKADPDRIYYCFAKKFQYLLPKYQKMTNKEFEDVCNRLRILKAESSLLASRIGLPW